VLVRYTVRIVATVDLLATGLSPHLYVIVILTNFFLIVILIFGIIASDCDRTWISLNTKLVC
jgi:hypothetical protein